MKLYENISHTRGIPLDNHVISLKRPEWQQPADISPPIRIRLPGQRRRRPLGSFPQTENDVSICRRPRRIFISFLKTVN